MAAALSACEGAGQDLHGSNWYLQDAPSVGTLKLLKSYNVTHMKHRQGRYALWPLAQTTVLAVLRG